MLQIRLSFVKNRFLRAASQALFAATLILCFSFQAAAQKESSVQARRRGLDMLKNAKQLVEQHYYDQNFRGVNLEEKFAAAAEQIKTAENNSQIYTIIAQFLLALDDSHTSFAPPLFSRLVDYGIEMQMVGKVCHVTWVGENSDAAAKGIKVGDIVHSFNSFTPTRESFWQLEYLFYSLNPIESYKIVLLNPNGTLRELEVKARFDKTKDLFAGRGSRNRRRAEAAIRCKTIKDTIAVCKLETFLIADFAIDRMLNEIERSQSLILDLRGNAGGYVETLKRLIGRVFDRDVKIGDAVSRAETKSEIAKSVKGKVYNGKLTVLVDSESASAAEVFARVVQLEKRGAVIGDRTAGMVTTARRFDRESISVGFNDNAITPYSISVTVADLIMSDGKSLEKVGVRPDILFLTARQHLANEHDPVLKFALEEFGLKLLLAEVAQLFPRK